MAILEDEFLMMYIEESKEHLETIESDLLEIERNGEDINEELVNKVFRAAHSIKGGSGFLGGVHIQELSHMIENILDMIRNFQLVPSADLINVLLKAFDRLGELLDDVVNSDEMEIEVHVIALKEILTASLGKSEKKIVDRKIEVPLQEESPSFKINQFDLIQARKGGKNLYVLKFDLMLNLQYQDKPALNLLKELSEAGVILDTQIDRTIVGDQGIDKIATVVPMYVLYSSEIEEDLLATLPGLESSKITQIPKDQDVFLEKVEIHEEEEEEEEEELVEPQESIEQEVEFAKQKAVKKQILKVLAKSENLRVPVTVLDQLMNRAGELVLARNELLQAISGGEKKAMLAAGQRIDTVTSELQEAIMLTRMQPIGSIFNKFTRVVRDLAEALGKQISLSIEGGEVDLDKSIIEGLADPLTHLVRNSCDHGIEQPHIRTKKGKPVEGRISFRAFHESGQVIIEIEDDGRGLNLDSIAKRALSKGLITEEQMISMSDNEKTNLIMLPGFSTAEEVTDISGRGVGMDVVKTNLDHLGGQIDLLSEVDKGTTIRIKLPLTLAIIPCLLVENGSERFAIPQVNVGELLRIPTTEIRERIEKVGDADVLILRGELIPLLQLNNVLKLEQTYYNRKLGTFRADRRSRLSDQRLQSGADSSGEASERRARNASAVSIAILQSGSFRFGLVVEKVHDTLEIVVKPLGRHLKSCAVYAGATIMGDGHLALILDVAGLGKLAELHVSAERTVITPETEIKDAAEGTTRQTLLLFHNGPDELCAVPLHQVLHIEQIETEKIQIKGGKKVIQYRGGSLVVYALEEVAHVETLEECSQLMVMIFVVARRTIGLLAIPPLDIIEQDIIIDEVTLKQPGIRGSAIINGETTLLLDIFDFIKVLNPNWFEEGEATTIQPAQAREEKNFGKSILLAEDSRFFRLQAKQFMESEGYTVIDFEDGQLAWDYLDANPDEIALVITDLEMPRMGGLELTKRIKEDDRLSHLKVIALTSLAAEEQMVRGKEIGIDDYQIKLDKEKLLQGIHLLIL